MNLRDRLSKLEASCAPIKAERWRANMQWAQDGLAEARRKLADVIQAKLAEHGIDPDHLPPQTPEEHAQAMRELLNTLRARILD